MQLFSARIQNGVLTKFNLIKDKKWTKTPKVLKKNYWKSYFLTHKNIFTCCYVRDLNKITSLKFLNNNTTIIRPQDFGILRPVLSLLGLSLPKLVAW